MADSYLPLAATLLVATFAVPVAAVAAADKYSGRMVIIGGAPGATVVSAVGSLNKWQQRRWRLVEDEVAPEFGGGQLLVAGNDDDSLNYKGLIPNKQVCVKTPCAAPGGSYRRPCTYKDYCTHTPTAVHV